MAPTVQPEIILPEIPTDDTGKPSTDTSETAGTIKNEKAGPSLPTDNTEEEVVEAGPEQANNTHQETSTDPNVNADQEIITDTKTEQEQEKVEEIVAIGEAIVEATSDVTENDAETILNDNSLKDPNSPNSVQANPAGSIDQAATREQEERDAQNELQQATGQTRDQGTNGAKQETPLSIEEASEKLKKGIVQHHWEKHGKEAIAATLAFGAAALELQNKKDEAEKTEVTGKIGQAAVAAGIRVA
jgi:hypothetical protein